MSTFFLIFIVLFFISNSIFFAFIIKFEKNNKKSLFFWIFVVLIFNFLGFFAYIFLSSKLKFKAKGDINFASKSLGFYLSKTSWFKKGTLPNAQDANIKWVQNKFFCLPLKYESLEKYIWGKDFFNQLFVDIKKAKSLICLEFYIFADDEYGTMLKNLLIEKLHEGVKVNIVYDAVGSAKTSGKFWQELKDNGANVFAFFPSNLKNQFLNFKINYRNHRKICIIDGWLGYIGGINIRRDHMGKKRKLSPWKDAHLKLLGSVCLALTGVFLNDFIYTGKIDYKTLELDKLFPPMPLNKGTNVQILSSGPSSDRMEIYNTYLHFIEKAKKYILIQTPYFAVEKSIISALLLASKRGTRVDIMIPLKPDKKLVFASTLECLKPLLENGIRIWQYKGFLHSKTFLTESVFSIGSCNFDNRSFKLNFESTALFFNNKLIKEQFNAFENDTNSCTPLTLKRYKKIKAKNLIFLALNKILTKFF